MSAVVQLGPFADITEPGVRRVPMTMGYYALVDAADFDLVSCHRWRALLGHTGKVYATAKADGACIYMHRLIAGTPDGFETDHRNGDGLDNRRSNLPLEVAS